MFPIYRIWCKNNREWEKHPTAITPAGNILQYQRGNWHACDPQTHTIVFQPETEKIKSLDEKGYYEFK